jgi:hypothetical protein
MSPSSRWRWNTMPTAATVQSALRDAARDERAVAEIARDQKDWPIEQAADLAARAAANGVAGLRPGAQK